MLTGVVNCECSDWLAVYDSVSADQLQKCSKITESKISQADKPPDDAAHLNHV